VAGAEGLLRRDGPDGRLSSRLVRELGAEVGADRVGGRCSEPFFLAGPMSIRGFIRR